MKVLFDVDEYKKLLYEIEDKIYDVEFLKSKKFSELVSFQKNIEAQLSYNSKDKYFELITEYLGNSISSRLFAVKFTELSYKRINHLNKLKNDFDALSNFWIDPELDEFNSLLSKMDDFCSSIIDAERDDWITDQEFYNSIKNDFLQLKKSLEFIDN